MSRYVVRRALQVVPVLLGATFLIHALVFAMPGDPIRSLAGGRALSPAVVEALRVQYHLDDPLVVQYGRYLAGLTRGDLGTDFRGRPVTDYLRTRLPVTTRLALLAIAVEVLLGIAAGMVAALRRGRFLDSLVLVSTTVTISIPVFVLGFLAQRVLGVELGWFAIAGIRHGWSSYLLPAIVLGSTSVALLARLMRASLLEQLQADYIRTARAKGLPRHRVIVVHALRNSLLPVVTFVGVDLGHLMTGAVVVETIFNLPGIGRTIFEAIIAQEGTLVVGVVTFFVLVFIVANLAVDLLYALLDPRIRYE